MRGGDGVRRRLLQAFLALSAALCGGVCVLGYKVIGRRTSLCVRTRAVWSGWPPVLSSPSTTRKARKSIDRPPGYGGTSTGWRSHSGRRLVSRTQLRTSPPAHTASWRSRSRSSYCPLPRGRSGGLGTHACCGVAGARGGARAAGTTCARAVADAPNAELRGGLAAALIHLARETSRARKRNDTPLG